MNTHKKESKPNQKSMPVNVLSIFSYYWGKGYKNDSVNFLYLFFKFINKYFLISSTPSSPPIELITLKATCLKCLHSLVRPSLGIFI